MLPLEDHSGDVVLKAMRGLGFTPASLAARAGLSTATVEALGEGDVQPGALAAVASVLGLDADALLVLARGEWHPGVPPPEGLLTVTTPYGGFLVNAYVVWRPGTQEACAFDTGADAAPMLEALAAHGLSLRAVFVTHTHRDHVGALEPLVAATGATVYAPEAEPVPGARPVSPGESVLVGGLHVTALRTTGHTVGGTSYRVEGLAEPLVVVGDALFAASMGGGRVSFPDALANNRRALLTLPPQTVVAPGHGPLTRVGLENRHNPFYGPGSRG